MDFKPSPQVEALRERVRAFMDEHIYPQELEIEEALDREVSTTTAFPEILIEIREKAKADGLWNLFLPDEDDGTGLPTPSTGSLYEEMGRIPIAAQPSTAGRRTPATWRSSSSSPQPSSVSAGSSRCWRATSAAASR